MPVVRRCSAPPQCLAAAGLTADQIDEVYITHCHGDHLHGTVTPEGGRMFPSAILRIAKPDLDYWGSAAEEAKAPEAQRGRWLPAKRTIAADGTPIAAVHLPFPGIGCLRKNGDAFTFQAAPWQLF